MKKFAGMLIATPPVNEFLKKILTCKKTGKFPTLVLESIQERIHKCNNQEIFGQASNPDQAVAVELERN